MAGYICPRCGYEGKGHTSKRGSGGVEIFIYATIFFPGPIYSLWRRVRLPRFCPDCKLRMVSKSSDQGVLIQHKIDMELGLVKPIEKKEPPPPTVPPPEAFFEERAVPRGPKAPVDPNQW